MAKKPLLDATSRAPSPYSEFTKNYRMSDYVTDRRGSEFDEERNDIVVSDYVTGRMKEFPEIKIEKFPDRLPEKMQEYVDNSKKK